MNLALEPKTTALILIDLQQGIVASNVAPYSSAQVVENARVLSKAFRAAGATVVFSHVLVTELLTPEVDAPTPPKSGPPPANASELVGELDVQPTDVVVAKRQWGAFYGTDLEQQLRRRGIKTLVMGGIATNMGVESTARAAFDMGYELVFAEDALSSISAEAQQFVVANIFPRMGRVRSTQQIVQALPPTT